MWGRGPRGNASCELQLIVIATENELITLHKLHEQDWTATGAYGGLPGLAADALTGLEGNFDAMLVLLRNISIVTDPESGTMPSQGVAVYTPPFIADFLDGNNGIEVPDQAFAPSFPEWFDEKNFDKLWPHSLRSIQNAEASVVDAFIRSLFGWRPQVGSGSNSAGSSLSERIEASLYLPDVPRRCNLTLRNLRTPFGDGNVRIDIHAGESGLSWRFSSK